MSVIDLICPPGPSDTGAYRLSWSGPEGALFRLEENGSVVYEGPELATTVSGRAPRDYVYRVGVREPEREAVASWSPTCTVSVAPPSLNLAFGLFALGFVVFVSLLVVIVRGHRAHRRGEIG